MAGPYKWKHGHQGLFSRWTEPRKAILNLLRRTSKHMSAKEIYTSLHRYYPGLGLTTVYRTLDLLARMGIIQKFSFGDGQARYEYKSDTEEEHHHHLVCSRCGKIIDYTEFTEEELQLIQKIESTLEKKYDFEVQGHNIEFYGLCKNCKQN